MRKVLGFLALTLAVSGIASADQDFLKSLNYSTELRQGYIEKDGADANGIGWTGFKGANRDRTRLRNTLSGSLVLSDEANFGLDFSLRNDNDRYRRGTNAAISRRDSDWETKLTLSKKANIGNLDTTWKLGWEYDSNARKADGKSEHFTTRGRSNQFFFGPTFKYSLFGFNVSNKLEAVYFEIKGVEKADYSIANTEGWGINFDVDIDRDILKGNYGTVNTYAYLTNHLRDGSGKGEKTDVYLDYGIGITYTTPSFAGFYGQVNFENEWERNTIGTYNWGWGNYASAWLTAGYKTTLDTSVGNISVNPFVKYKPWSRETYKDDAERYTKEYNEWRVGLKVSLSAK